MIIKKKYMTTGTETKKDIPATETPKTAVRNPVEGKGNAAEENAVRINRSEQAEQATQPEKPEQKNLKEPAEKKTEKIQNEEKKPAKKAKTKKSDLDLSLDDIKFEPRPERREGTRRRGYRRTQDRNIVSRAKQDAVSIKESAKLDGYNAGLENAQKDLEEIKVKLAEFYNLKNDVFMSVSDCIYDVALEIAKKILNKQVEADKEYLIPLIKAAVEEVNPTENKIVFKVMPKDVEIVKEKLPEIFKSGDTEAVISVAADKTIKDGGVIIETSNGIIDASIETQLAIMEKVMAKNKGETE